jgi:hypothetical protein
LTAVVVSTSRRYAFTAVVPMGVARETVVPDVLKYTPNVSLKEALAVRLTRSRVAATTARARVRCICVSYAS